MSSIRYVVCRGQGNCRNMRATCVRVSKAWCTGRSRMYGFITGCTGLLPCPICFCLHRFWAANFPIGTRVSPKRQPSSLTAKKQTTPLPIVPSFSLAGPPWLIGHDIIPQWDDCKNVVAFGLHLPYPCTPSLRTLHPHFTINWRLCLHLRKRHQKQICYR